MKNYIHKLINKLLEMYPSTLFVIEKPDKQGMFKNASNSLSKKISRIVWRSIQTPTMLSQYVGMS